MTRTQWKPRLIIFDCDGVLVDTEPISVRIDTQILNGLGCSITQEEVIERFVGRSDTEMHNELRRDFEFDLPPDLDRQTEHLYREAYQRELKPVKGIEQLLERITIESCVASSGTHDKMKFTLGLTGLYKFFEGRIYSASEVKHGKPAPDLFLHAAEQMGIPTEDCVVIEDSPYGLQAAQAAGMRAFAYGGGIVPRERLQLSGVTVFDSMADLPALLGF
jgi:HAD superfamily hydrolase (TIGR01509 family)